MFKELNRLVKSNEFKIIVFSDRVNIINYDEIVIFEENNIFIRACHKNIRIKGSNLFINKLYNDELLIEGNINTIDMEDF